MRLNIDIIAPWLLGKLDSYWTWKIWFYHIHKDVTNEKWVGAGVRVLGFHFMLTNAAGWKGISFSINF